MKRNDFPVIVYGILSYLYDTVKKGKAVDFDVFDSVFFGIKERYFQFILKELYGEGFIRGCEMIDGKETADGFDRVLPRGDFQITMAGIEYLLCDEWMEKTKPYVEKVFHFG